MYFAHEVDEAESTFYGASDAAIVQGLGIAIARIFRAKSRYSGNRTKLCGANWS